MRRQCHTVKDEVDFFRISTSRIICVLRWFLDATRSSYREIRCRLTFGPPGASKWSLLERLGSPWDPSVVKTCQRGSQDPSGGQKWSRNGGHWRLKIESKIVLISGAEKVVDLEAQKLEKRTLGTSKTSQIHWRCYNFQTFAFSSGKPLFNACPISKRCFGGCLL